MKPLLLLAALALSPAAFAEPNTEVFQEVHLRPISILSDLEIRKIVEVFDQESPLKSYLWLEVSGTYEGNICGGDRVALSKTSIPTNDLMHSEYDVALHKMALWTDRFSLVSPFCTADSRPVEFRGLLELHINFWDNDRDLQTWIYHFKDDRDAALKTLTVTFSKTAGWTVRN